jgi:deoxyhypusine synthase
MHSYVYPSRTVQAPTVLGDFQLKGTELRKKGWNRIGNLLVPNNNYCLFEEWLQVG